MVIVSPDIFSVLQSSKGRKHINNIVCPDQEVILVN